MNGPAITMVAATAVVLGWTLPSAIVDGPQRAAPPDIVLSDNLEPAGTLNGGVLELELDIVEGVWRPLPDQPAATVLAFAERGGAPSNPGPVIRVPVGTEVRVTIANPLDTVIVVHGLGSRRTGSLEPVRIAARSTREVRFPADAEGTYYYWGAVGDTPIGRRIFEDSQLNGALIIEAPETPSEDRILIMAMWSGGRLADGSPDIDRELLVFNGRPWPHSERLAYDMGDTIRWRLINASFSPHSMHLHGFYFRVDARGDNARDTVYWESGRRNVVTERTDIGSTMLMTWTPDRPGGWIFHCHMAEHVIPNPPMEPGPEDANRFETLMHAGHHDADPDAHATEGMGGLVMGAYIRPPDGWAPNEPKRREMRLFIQSAPASGGISGRQFSYILQEGDTEPAPDSVRLPGSTLILRQGEPTSIRVFNHTDEPSQVHWHGLEIESYFDGVAGMSGYPDRLTPAIAPGDSFEIRITPPRAGSFMYHTHINDLRQQGSGLYGAFVILEADEQWDPETDRIFLYGETPFRDDAMPVLNGEETPDPITFRVGTAYRLRFMQITLGRPNTRIRLLDDGFPVRWRPIAKDGFDLPLVQRDLITADQFLAVGETYDFEFQPTGPGELQLEYRTGGGVLLVKQQVRVIE